MSYNPATSSVREPAVRATNGQSLYVALTLGCLIAISAASLVRQLVHPPEGTVVESPSLGPELARAATQADESIAGNATVGATDARWALPTLDRAHFETRLENNSPWVLWAKSAYAPVVDELLNRGNAKVIFGRKNWLFYYRALDYVTGPPVGSDPATVIVDVHQQLQAAGIDLLVVPVPVKATLHPEKLWPQADPSSLPNNRGFEDFVKRLRAADVEVLDLAPALLAAKLDGHPQFLPRDTHWSPEGMLFSARAVAERVETLPAWSDLAAGAEAFDRRLVEFEAGGDIYGMLAYAHRQRNWRPMRFLLQQVIASETLEPPRSRQSPILLLGDSLTNIFSDGSLGSGQQGGFAEHLAFNLGWPIDVVAMPGGGASGSRRALALRSAPLAGKRLVIWQFTQRDLVHAASGWLPVDLRASEQPLASDSAANGEPSGSSYTVLAIPGANTRLPANLDYKDCLIVSRFLKVDGELPGVERVFDVLQWGVRDWQPTAATHQIRDRAVQLVLKPLPEDIDLETTCWLDTIGTTGRLWWVEQVSSP